MADREKVIKGLKHCDFGSSNTCYEKECPYYQIHCCTDELKNDILALLKEQDAVEPQEEQEKRILSIVWDVLHDGVSTDTKVDQDFVYELILEKVNNYDKDVNRNGLPGEGS